jgi:hypothetical protein
LGDGDGVGDGIARPWTPLPWPSPALGRGPLNLKSLAETLLQAARSYVVARWYSGLE